MRSKSSSFLSVIGEFGACQRRVSGRDGRVLIYIHKEEALDDVERRFPAEHYVIADDKLRILAAVKRFWRNRVTTVFVRQGAYARDPQMVSAFPPADITIERIGDLLSGDLLSGDLQRSRPAPLV